MGHGQAERPARRVAFVAACLEGTPSSSWKSTSVALGRNVDVFILELSSPVSPYRDHWGFQNVRGQVNCARGWLALLTPSGRARGARDPVTPAHTHRQAQPDAISALGVNASEMERHDPPSEPVESPPDLPSGIQAYLQSHRPGPSSLPSEEAPQSRLRGPDTADRGRARVDHPCRAPNGFPRLIWGP